MLSLMCLECLQGMASDNLNATAGPARVHMTVAQEQRLHLLHDPGMYAVDLLLAWVVCLCQRDGVPNLECSGAVKGHVSKASLGAAGKSKLLCNSHQAATAIKWQEGTA